MSDGTRQFGFQLSVFQFSTQNLAGFAIARRGPFGRVLGLSILSGSPTVAFCYIDGICVCHGSNRDEEEELMRRDDLLGINDGTKQLTKTDRLTAEHNIYIATKIF
jgi:hypothetical protein